ncbi:MAG TPA: hypothetical protein VE890_03260, partial [Thermoguttaceae bacterium]|nr:hypothetical protein [Thermoguttaceae bacterium]
KNPLSTSSTALVDGSIESLLSETTGLLEQLSAKPATASEQGELVDVALELSDLLTDDSGLSAAENGIDLLLPIV